MLTQYKLDSDTARLMRRRAGAYVRGLRQDANLTQQQLAKALGYDYYTMISQVERGQARVPPEDYSKWAELLGMPPSVFAKTLLSFYDPYTYFAVFGGEHPIEQARKWAAAQQGGVTSCEES